MQRPSVERLPDRLARAACAVARVLAREGHRAWLVGGSVRDLALGIEPGDADMATAAHPDEIRALFPRTHAVGRAFGTVVVHEDSVDIEVTTFRAESGYDDARHPTHVRFSSTLEEDAARRDFTCNALYLDPLADELVDPTGGLADLEAGCLRCVGDPRERFREDGLRLLRLARLAAQHDLAIEEHTAEAARLAVGSLRGVSAERVLAELTRMAEGARPARAARSLLALGLWHSLPVLGQLDGPESRVAALERLASIDTACFFAVLIGPARDEELERRLESFLALRPSRALVQRVRRALELAAELEECLAELAGGSFPRSRRVRLVRREEFAEASACWRAWNPGRSAVELERLERLARESTHAELWPDALVTSSELARAGIPPGPRWRELLEEGEGLQLDGRLASLEDARAWLARRAAEPARSGGREDAP